MNAITFNDAMQELVPRLAWTLIHSMWQGVAVAAALLVALRLLRDGSAQARYIAGCVAMLTLVIACASTFIVQRSPSAIPLNHGHASSFNVPPVQFAAAPAASLASSRMDATERTD